MAPTIITLVACICAFWCLNGVECADDYCVANIINNNATFMQFTKEASAEEFAIVGKFKGLHCCAKGYRSIEWVKNGVHYPWPGTSSQFILYPDSANQTIYTQNVNLNDAGNYTCILRNDSFVVTHTMQLYVYDADAVPDDPKTTYISPDKEITLGDPARLFCEAFVGYVDLPDAQYEATWFKNDSIVDKPHVRQENVSRLDEQTFGTYLLIESVKPQDYGHYVCRISKPGKSKDLDVYLKEKVFGKFIEPNPVPLKQIGLIFAVVFLVGFTIVTLCVKYGLSVRVNLKDRFGKLEEEDGKVNDVLIVHSPSDTEIALGVLLPTLESRFHYKCGSKELPSNISTWCTHLAESAKRSRRIVAVISPATLNESWDCNALYKAIKQLQYFEPNFTCVLLKQVPRSEGEVKNSQGETLSSVLGMINVVHWEASKDDSVWLAMRLRLPPKRVGCPKLDHLTRPAQRTNGNSPRLTNGTNDCHHELV